MATQIFIGEMNVNGTGVPVYIAQDLHRRAMITRANYTGHSDITDRCSRLIDGLQDAMTSGKTNFGYRFDDQDWSQDPDKIESATLDVAVKLMPGRILLETNARRIERGSAEFEKIATAALAAVPKNHLQMVV